MSLLIGRRQMKMGESLEWFSEWKAVVFGIGGCSLSSLYG